MPKIQHVIPSEVIESAKHQTTNSTSKTQSRIYNKGEAKDIPKLENVTIGKSSSKGTRHYFQQFHETKRFVGSFLRKHKNDVSIESELQRISISMSLPHQNEIPINSMGIGDNGYFAGHRHSSNRPKTADIKTRKFDVHFGTNLNDYTNADLEYFGERFFDIEGGNDESSGIQDESELCASPDRVFNEEKSKRTKKKPKAPKIPQHEIAVVKEEVFPEWINMREKVLYQIIQIVTRIVAAVDVDRSQYRQELMSLMTVLQHSTLKIVEFFISSRDHFAYRLQNSSWKERQTEKWQSAMQQWQDWERYVEELPTSLNWLEDNPFRLWCGIHFTLNPLLACFDLQHELAVVLNEQLHEVIQYSSSDLFNIRSSMFISNPAVVSDLQKQISIIHKIELPLRNSDPQYSPEIMSLVAKELRYDEAFHFRLLKASDMLRSIHTANIDKRNSMKQEMQTLQQRQRIEESVTANIAQYNRLTFLIFRSNKSEELQNKADIVRGNTRLFNTKNYFHLWQRCKYYEVCVRYIGKRTKVRIFRWILSGLHASKIQKYRLAALQDRAQKSQLHVLWDRWRANLNWWKRFDSIYERSNRSRLTYVLDQWRQYMEDKQRQRISSLLPLLQPKFERAQSHAADQAESSLSNVMNWIQAKAVEWVSRPVQSLIKSTDSNCFLPSHRWTRPHHHAYDDDDVDEIPNSSEKLSEANRTEQIQMIESSISRLELRGLEEQVAEDIARSILLQKRAFQLWRLTYKKRIFLQRLIFIWQDHKVWAAWRHWRACVPEWRFEAKVEKRKLELLRDMLDRSSSSASLGAMSQSSQHSLLSRSMSVTMDATEGIDEEIGLVKKSKDMNESINGSFFHQQWTLNPDALQNAPMKSPIMSPEFSSEKLCTVRSVPMAFSMKDVPIVMRRRKRLGEEEDQPKEIATSSTITKVATEFVNECITSVAGDGGT